MFCNYPMKKHGPGCDAWYTEVNHRLSSLTSRIEAIENVNGNKPHSDIEDCDVTWKHVDGGYYEMSFIQRPRVGGVSLLCRACMSEVVKKLSGSRVRSDG